MAAQDPGVLCPGEERCGGLALRLGDAMKGARGGTRPCQCLRGEIADGTRTMWPEQIFRLSNQGAAGLED